MARQVCPVHRDGQTDPSLATGDGFRAKYVRFIGTCARVQLGLSEAVDGPREAKYVRFIGNLRAGCIDSANGRGGIDYSGLKAFGAKYVSNIVSKHTGRFPRHRSAIRPANSISGASWGERTRENGPGRPLASPRNDAGDPDV